MAHSVQIIEQSRDTAENEFVYVKNVHIDHNEIEELAKYINSVSEDITIEIKHLDRVHTWNNSMRPALMLKVITHDN